MGKSRTITLTNRPPVKIDEDNWPILADASDETHDGQVRCQANRTSTWRIVVRQHEDGRALVYATYSYDTNWQNAKNLAHKHGDYLNYKADDAHIITSITNVAARMEEGEHKDDDASQWKRLRDECIADMPAEDIDATKPDPGFVADVLASEGNEEAKKLIRDLKLDECPHNWLGGYCDLCGAVKPE